MEKKKILILGAGNAQIDAIEYCKAKGYWVIGCSYTAVDNGIPYLDDFEQVDIKDVQGIVNLARDKQAELIYSVGSDVAMPTVMAASEALGLPHYIKPETALTCQSKVKMRKALGEDFAGNVAFTECLSIDDARSFSGFPAMMKPSDSQGQRGCFKVECFEDIRKEFQTSMNFSNEKKVILESFLTGPEVSVNAFFVKGEMRFAMVSDRIAFSEYPGGIIKEHVVPSSLDDDTQQKVKDVAAGAAERTGIADGPCYFQIKLDSEGDPKILEITPRLDGCHMWNLIKTSCGVDLLAASFEYLAGEEPDLSIKKEPESYRLVFYSQHPWTAFHTADFDSSDAEYSFFYYKEGDKVRRLNGYIEKCGYKIVKA